LSNTNSALDNILVGERTQTPRFNIAKTSG
jgi:hypothetical protein